MSVVAKFTGLVGMVLLALTACSTNSASVREALPLAEDQPTFVFFFTENWPPWAQMRPIVDRLQAEFGDQMAFVYSNALLEGKQAFEQLALPGHPSFVLFSAEQAEVYRTFGEFNDARLHDAILSHLNNAN